MPEVVKGVDVSEPGFITIATSSGPPTRYPVADLLRAADIPVGLTHTQVDGLRLLANLMAVLIRVMREEELIDEDFADSFGMGWDLAHIIYVLEQLGGSFENPDFNNVEVA